MKKKKIFIIIIAILVIGAAITFFLLMPKKEAPKNEEPKVEEKVTAGIYNRVINPTNYQKTIFEELKVAVSTTPVDEKALALAIAKNFMVEFYNLSNVTSKDVRAIQYVAIDLQDRYKAFGKEVYDYYLYYKNIKNLEVKNLEITLTKEIEYDYKDDLGLVKSKSDLPGYVITINWSYKDNTSYVTKLTIVKWDDNYSVVKVDNSLND